MHPVSVITRKPRPYSWADYHCIVGTAECINGNKYFISWIDVVTGRRVAVAIKKVDEVKEWKWDDDGNYVVAREWAWDAPDVPSLVRLDAVARLASGMHWDDSTKQRIEYLQPSIFSPGQNDVDGIVVGKLKYKLA